MISIQSLLSKSVINLESGKHVGYIKNIVINNAKISHIVCFSEGENDFENEFTLPTKTILSCQNDAVMIKSDAGLTLIEEDNFHAILGSNIYTQEGVLKGKITDIICNLKFGILEVKNSDKSIPISKIDNISNGLVILKGKYKIKKMPAKISIASTNQIVTIEENLASSLPVISAVDEPKMDVNVPKQTLANPKQLIGKIIKQSIIHNNKVLIKQGTIITQKTIDLAQISGNLKTLARLCY